MNHSNRLPDKKDRGLDKIAKAITLETGLLAGGLLFSLGVGGSFYALYTWGSDSFGPQEPSRLMRTIIPSTLLLALGAQTVFNSFFLSILSLKQHHATN